MPPPGAHTPCRLLVLTGAPGVGKTTLATNVARDVAANAPHVQVLGFFTEEVRNEAGDRVGFDVVTLDGQQRAALARVEELSAAADGAPRVGKYVVDIASFESVTLPCLALAAEGKQPQLLLIDEMGKMEAFSDRFVAAIEQTLATSASRGRATLMVVANKGTGIIAACKARNDSSAFTLNEKSRDTLAPTAVTEKLRTLFGIRPHSWEVLPVRKDDGVIRGPLNAAGGGGGGPGGKPASASASKNAKRRQKKAAAAAADAGGGGGSGGGGAVTEPAPAPAPAAAADPAKKARALQKKLRQIAELKEKQAGGAVLEANQLSKIEAEATLRAELEALGLG